MEKTLMARCREFFWSGVSMDKVKAEWVALTEKDKNELCDMFNKAGMPTSMVK